jgi:hypothetical protein
MLYLVLVTWLVSTGQVVDFLIYADQATGFGFEHRIPGGLTEECMRHAREYEAGGALIARCRAVRCEKGQHPSHNPSRPSMAPECALLPG